jgi:hypothetical protein
MGIHERFFGRWQDKCIDRFVNFNVGGLYFLNARTFGLKGFLGGSHSWITFVSDDLLTHTVIEVTDVESLHIQGATSITEFGLFTGPTEKQVIMSNRDGGQLWFGEQPSVTYIGPSNIDVLLKWTTSYPLITQRFSLFNANCNTYTSWILHLLGMNLWTGIGCKSTLKWAKTVK